MKLILSPTKTMEMPATGEPEGVPPFEAEAVALVRELSKLTGLQIQALFKTSDVLTQKTLKQIRDFGVSDPWPALFVFRGEAFKTLNPSDFSRDDLIFANTCIGILSGLYGVLSPMDGIRPYRLDLNTPFKPSGESLQSFWRKRVIPWFEFWLLPGQILLNLASQEYAALLRNSPLQDRMITFQFRQRDGEKLKNNSVRAKQARGLFARAIIKNRLQDPAALKQLSPGGYVYSEKHSSPREIFFIQ